jgi:hypothetical protein
MYRWSVGLALLILAACHAKAPDEKRVLQQSAELVKPLPGLYSSTTRLTAFDLPNADPQTEDAMRDKFGQVMPQTRTFCLSSAAAKRGFQDLFTDGKLGHCTFDEFAADRNRMHAELTCRSGDVVSTVSVAGIAAPEESHVALEIVQEAADIPGGRETLSLAVDNRRLGDCSAGNRGG